MSRKVDRQMSKVAANTAFVLAGGGSLGAIQVQRIVARRHRYLPLSPLQSQFDTLEKPNADEHRDHARLGLRNGP
jgi:gluconate kinase